MFRNGDLFEYRFDTEAGSIGFLAEVEISGDTLHLKDIAVYPIGPHAKIAAGTGEVLQALRMLEGLARKQGLGSCGLPVSASPEPTPERMLR